MNIRVVSWIFFKPLTFSSIGYIVIPIWNQLVDFEILGILQIQITKLVEVKLKTTMKVPITDVIELLLMAMSATNILLITQNFGVIMQIMTTIILVTWLKEKKI